MTSLSKRRLSSSTVTTGSRIPVLRLTGWPDLIRVADGDIHTPACLHSLALEEPTVTKKYLWKVAELFEKLRKVESRLSWWRLEAPAILHALHRGCQGSLRATHQSPHRLWELKHSAGWGPAKEKRCQAGRGTPAGMLLEVWTALWICKRRANQFQMEESGSV